MPDESDGFSPDPSARVQRFRKRPVVVDMIRWDGTEEAQRLIRRNSGASPFVCSDPACAGALMVWVGKGQANAHVPLGDWVALEPDGTGVYPLTEADREAGYEPVTEGVSDE